MIKATMSIIEMVFVRYNTAGGKIRSYGLNLRCLEDLSEEL